MGCSDPEAKYAPSPFTKESNSQEESQKSSSNGGNTNEVLNSVNFPLNCRKRYKLGINQ